MTTRDLAGEAMPFPDRQTVNVLLTILLFAVVLAVVYIARTVLIVFCFAILFAYLINPVIQFLQRHSLFLKDLRGPHVAEAYVVLLIVVGLSVYAVLPKSVGHASKLLRDLPSLSDRLVTGEMATEMGHHYGWSDAETLRTKTFLVEHRSSIEKLMSAIEEFATTGLGAMAVIPILAIFFLSGGQDLADRVIGLMATHNNRQNLESVTAELNDDTASLHTREGDSRRIVFRLYLDGATDFGIPAWSSLGCPCRSLGVHSHRRLDNGRSDYRHGGRLNARSLDMDGGLPRRLASAYRLLDRSTGLRA